ncbi:MAG: SAM-dependent methyltransferase [Burkholderiales bacterium RIFCSPLOWO2_02_FULL_57_36]|nr:MAG: SAM-dependent methyltransferase [Burkholderiales bacterium RIFCSPLOWO2_02_FULL_57_36]
MHANSSPIVSSQADIHDQLEKLVARHAASRFLKPITPYSEAAFNASITAWRAAGEPPLILDAGCGTGVSTLNLAARFPEHFVIGVDQSADRLGRKIAWPGTLPSNFTKVRADLIDYWRLMQQAEIHPDRHYVLYPNPWPKKHHIGRRWHGHPVFPAIVALGGHFECRSNWRIYIEECAAALKQLTAIKVETEAYYPEKTEVLERDSNILSASSFPITPFEGKYLASGHSLWRCRIHIVEA